MTDNLHDLPEFDGDLLARDLRLAFDLPLDAPDSDVNACLWRMSAAGFDVVTSEVVEAEMAQAIRVACDLMAIQCRRIADAVAAMPDGEVLSSRAEIRRQALVPPPTLQEN